MKVLFLFFTCFNIASLRSIPVNCGPRDSAPLVEKKIGKKYPLVCEDSCDDGVYNYSVYNVATGETEIVHQGSYRYHFDVNGDGIYCCACADNPIALATNSQCCVHIVVRGTNSSHNSTNTTISPIITEIDSSNHSTNLLPDSTATSSSSTPTPHTTSTDPVYDSTTTEGSTIMEFGITSNCNGNATIPVLVVIISLLLILLVAAVVALIIVCSKCRRLQKT
ncbi:uncharacterized protein [Dysidea avara]|uniref:uncharacterized protein n=1 Tax=Dysidea avara TaxID=196820 RepID=UPI00332EE3BD